MSSPFRGGASRAGAEAVTSGSAARSSTRIPAPPPTGNGQNSQSQHNFRKVFRIPVNVCFEPNLYIQLCDLKC